MLFLFIGTITINTQTSCANLPRRCDQVAATAAGGVVGLALVMVNGLIAGLNPHQVAHACVLSAGLTGAVVVPTLILRRLCKRAVAPH